MGPSPCVHGLCQVTFTQKPRLCQAKASTVENCQIKCSSLRTMPSTSYHVSTILSSTSIPSSPHNFQCKYANVNAASWHDCSSLSSPSLGPRLPLLASPPVPISLPKKSLFASSADAVGGRASSPVFTSPRSRSGSSLPSEVPAR